MLDKTTRSTARMMVKRECHPRLHALGDQILATIGGIQYQDQPAFGTATYGALDRSALDLALD